jgi:hypothetical protein
MIQAENPEKTSHNQIKATVTKVHGFATPASPTKQEIHPHRKHTVSEIFFQWWHKIAVILLTTHGLVGTWESVKFIAIDFKKLENQLELHQIQTEEVNRLVAMAIIVAGTTLINIIMAIRLGKTKESTAHNIDLVIATILIISTKYIQEVLVQFDLLNIFINLF